jgi:hypothetical protein
MRRSSSTSNLIRPPTPINNLDLHTWFVGCALANPRLTQGPNINDAINQAISAADMMMSALRPAIAPTIESMPAPTASEMKRWEKIVEKRNLNKDRETVPALKPKVHDSDSCLTNKPRGFYSVKPGQTEE